MRPSYVLQLLWGPSLVQASVGPSNGQM